MKVLTQEEISERIDKAVDGLNIDDLGVTIMINNEVGYTAVGQYPNVFSTASGRTVGARQLALLELVASNKHKYRLKFGEDLHERATGNVVIYPKTIGKGLLLFNEESDAIVVANEYVKSCRTRKWLTDIGFFDVEIIETGQVFRLDEFIMMQSRGVYTYEYSLNIDLDCFKPSFVRYWEVRNLEQRHKLDGRFEIFNDNGDNIPEVLFFEQFKEAGSIEELENVFLENGLLGSGNAIYITENKTCTHLDIEIEKYKANLK